MEVIVREVAKLHGVAERSLLERQSRLRKENVPRKLVMYIAKRDVGLTEHLVAMGVAPGNIFTEKIDF